MKALVFDNSALSHFARAGALPTPERVTNAYRRVVPAEVIKEVVAGIPLHPALGAAIALPWLDIVELTELTEIVAFARYKAELGGGTERNNGESAVLAWARVNGGTAIIDERAGTRIARQDQIEVRGTMWLITNAVRSGEMTREAAERLVDQLSASDMALPVDGAGLFAWAYEEGLLP